MKSRICTGTFWGRCGSGCVLEGSFIHAIVCYGLTSTWQHCKKTNKWLLNCAWICSHNQPDLCVFKLCPSLGSQTRRGCMSLSRQTSGKGLDFFPLVRCIPSGSAVFVTCPVEEQRSEMFQCFVPFLPCPLAGSMRAGNAAAMAQRVPRPAWPVSHRVCAAAAVPAPRARHSRSPCPASADLLHFVYCWLSLALGNHPGPSFITKYTLGGYFWMFFLFLR